MQGTDTCKGTTKEAKMKKYKVTNKNETKEVMASSAQEACEKLGWMIGYYFIQEVRGGLRCYAH